MDHSHSSDKKSTHKRDNTPSESPTRADTTQPRQSLIKRLGFYGFMFFLIKGLLWLIVPALMVYFGYEWGAE